MVETSKGASSFILPEEHWKESERNRSNKISSNTGKVTGEKNQNLKCHFAKCSAEIQIMSDLSHTSAGWGVRNICTTFWTPPDKQPTRGTLGYRKEQRPSSCAASSDFMSDPALHQSSSPCLPLFISKTDFIDPWVHNSLELATVFDQRGSSRVSKEKVAHVLYWV